MQSSDAELIKAFQKGNQQAFESLVARYEKPIFGYIFLRINDYAAAEDITQETFWRAYRALKKRRFKWRDTGSKGLASWLFAIAQNCYKEWLRNRRDIQPRVPDSLLEQVAAKDDKQKKEIIENLLQSLKRLPEKYYVVLALKYQNGMTCAEIAKALDQPIGTVTSILARAYELLRQDPELGSGQGINNRI